MKQQYGRKVIGFILTVLFLLGVATPVFCMPAPGGAPAQAGNLDELLSWYRDGSSPACILTQEIRIDSPVVFDRVSKSKDIVALYGVLHVVNGGKLIIQDPGLAVMGPALLIEVDRGGTLELNAGSMWGADNADAVFVHKYGSFKTSGAFKVGGGTIKNENTPPETVAPPETNVPPETVAPPEANAPPETDNPQRPSPISDLSARLISVSSTSGIALIRLSLPRLPEDVTAIYLYYSMDGIRYARGTWTELDGNGGMIYHDNFVKQGVQGVHDGVQYLLYRRQSTDEPLWIQLEIVGSVRAGISNTVKLSTRLSEGADESDDDDGSFDGNRGGGGQGTSDRTGMVGKAASGPAATGRANAGSADFGGTGIFSQFRTRLDELIVSRSYGMGNNTTPEEDVTAACLNAGVMQDAEAEGSVPENTASEEKPAFSERAVSSDNPDNPDLSEKALPVEFTDIPSSEAETETAAMLDRTPQAALATLSLIGALWLAVKKRYSGKGP